ncbi:MAG: hypothetical protein A2157_12975 [Deltaproteobacteria bacterium RBG_16_47_11]|nr:MAG: hypothetical protein A2157_12975 [Deltaproteobacteria bacterium RBG_16_47_11]
MSHPNLNVTIFSKYFYFFSILISEFQEILNEATVQYVGAVWIPQNRGFLAKTEAHSEGWRMVDMIFR